MAEVNTMVRVGFISTVDKEKCMARVCYPALSNMVSGWLYILQRTGEELDIKTAGTYPHSHEGKSAKFVPKVNDKVLVLYPYGWNMDGYILGVIP